MVANCYKFYSKFIVILVGNCFKTYSCQLGFSLTNVLSESCYLTCCHKPSDFGYTSTSFLLLYQMASP